MKTEYKKGDILVAKNELVRARGTKPELEVFEVDGKEIKCFAYIQGQRELVRQMKTDITKHYINKDELKNT